MLKRFEVENFKNFKEKIVFDLTARDYNFNKGIVNNGIVNKAFVYGKNGIGKSNLGIAIFDIIMHLTDKERINQNYLQTYLNLDSSKKEAKFCYCFQFGSDEVVYRYTKKGPMYLLSEELFFNNKQVLKYDYFSSNRFIDSELIDNLQVELIDNKLSVVKYIYRNMPTNSMHPLLYKMMNFVNNMLWYRSLSDGNAYFGFQNGGSILTEMLYESGRTSQFKKLLNENGIDYDFQWQNNNGRHDLYVRFKEGRALFTEVASTGTNALLLFFVWSIQFEKVSFLFIDEFDAFFHYESAEYIVQILNKETEFQTVLTSHNTYLMQNSITRPDCCYIMTQNKISSLINCTDKEIREAHNLEKMYINGAFCN